ncbi:MAG: proprotein convertase P-domain-containing protein, partial [Ardenticatenales bacterium]|nr:proprotein convertase P-domain-containing protein [Ardenticatenales bacterium]MCC7020378.1 proprotein convertase P-domain-containing protein [Ardenticatenales bacterium]
EGEYPGDDWTLRITDNGAGDQGKLLNWTIQLRTRTNY